MIRYNLILVVSLLVAGAYAQEKEFESWVLQSPGSKGIVSSRGRAAKAHGPLEFDAQGWVQFTGNQWLSVDEADARLPETAFTIECWARVDQPTRWGSLFGFQQDNGSYEKGWSLGYNNDQFEFRVSDGQRIVNCTASERIRMGRWYHIVGICDPSSEQLRLYVDGLPQATVEFNADGPAYPDIPTELVIGAYRDKDESFPLFGALREVRLYHSLLPVNVIETHVRRDDVDDEKELEFAVRPGVRFLTPTSAEVRWETTIAGRAMVAFGPTRKLGTIVSSDEPSTSHRVTLTDLVPGETYFYRFGLVKDKKRYFSPYYELDGRMNYMPPTASLDVEVADAEMLIDRMRQPGGFAVVTGADNVDWAEMLASRSDLSVAVALKNQDEIDALRNKWYRQGEYGIRLTVQHVDDLPESFANLVITRDGYYESATSWVAPTGSIVSLGKSPEDQSFRWTALSDSIHWGEPIERNLDTAWGHQYGSASNQSYVGETLSGIDDTEDLKVQWLGRPGADFGIDRNPRMPAPLVAGGRLFHQGMNRMIALDAFNGSVLWSLEIPDLRRVNIPRDCGNWCADSTQVYAAVKDRLWVIDAATGKMRHTISMPPKYRQGFDWGFIADGGTLPDQTEVVIGTPVKQGSSYESFWDRASWYEEKNDSATSKVCGNAVVAYGKEYGDVRWHYPCDAVVHSTITIGDGKIYFVEVEDSSLRDEPTGKLPNSKIWKNAKLVCLDLHSGDVIWKVKAPPQKEQVLISYGLFEDGQFVFESSSDNQFHLYAYDADTGEQRWSQSADWPEDHHGAPLQHAVLMGGKIYVQPHIIDAATGDVLKSGTLGKRRGCATPVGAGGSILYRGGSGPLTFWSLENETTSEFTRLRPSCWLSSIPAHGMLFSPEGGGGCSCGGWMETSIGFIPAVNNPTVNNDER